MNTTGKLWEIKQHDSDYPCELKDLEKPPEIIYGRGNKEVLSEKKLSVIGARKATPYGLAVARMAGRIAAECNIVVVSGGALGCDSAASDSALKTAGKTIIVSGVGADLVYPASSRDVFDKAVANGGAVISLVPWGHPPTKWAFPIRNRIIAALGKCLFVCEAAIRSGTSSTAEVAAKIGRQIYAVPGSIFSSQSAGTNRLIADGASIIACEEDLEMNISLDFNCLRQGSVEHTPTSSKVLAALIASPEQPVDLAKALGQDPLTLLKTLSEYEAEGIVERLLDGRYSPTQSYLSGELK